MGRGLKYSATIFPALIDFRDFEDVTAVRAEPAALEAVESRLGLGGSDRLLGYWRRRRLGPGLFPVEEKKGLGGDDTNGQQNGDAPGKSSLFGSVSPTFAALLSLTISFTHEASAYQDSCIAGSKATSASISNRSSSRHTSATMMTAGRFERPQAAARSW